MIQETDETINETDLWKEDITSVNDIHGDIEFHNVNFVYPCRKDAPVLNNLSLIARAGETTALVGLSGCGEFSFENELVRKISLVLIIYSKAKVHAYHFLFVTMNLHLVK